MSEAFGLILPNPRVGSADHPLVPTAFIWRFPGWIIRWLDADTCECRFLRGLDDESVRKFRLLGSAMGVNAYEMHDKDPIKRAKALLGKARSLELAPIGAPVIIAAEAKTGDLKPDSFGRILSQIINADGVNVGDTLLAEDLAIPYSKP